MQRTRFLAGSAAALAAGCAAQTDGSLVPAAPATRSARTLVWSDEFDYTGLPDPSKWNYDVGGGGWGNGELEYYTHARLANANVSGGSLHITARHEHYRGSDYTSARVISKQTFKYGRFEVRAKMPGGRGTWPAIWLYPPRSVYGPDPKSGEIDVLENVGYSPLWAYPTIHVEHYDSIGKLITGKERIATIDADFHVYALDWTATGMDVLYDDRVILSYHPTATQLADWRYWPFNQEFYIILNVAVGGSWGGLYGVDVAAFPRTMEVDYVRVYR